MDFKYKKWIWLSLIALVVIAADQVSKKVVMAYLARSVSGLYPHYCDPDGPVEKRTLYFPKKVVVVIPGFFNLRYVANCGGAFGFLSEQKESVRRPFFYISSLLAGALLIYLFVRVRPAEKVLLVAFSIILGGAVGNIIDRVSLGFVVDFIDWHIRDRARWPTFNVADIGITVGLFLVLFDSFFLAPRREKMGERTEKRDSRKKR